MQRLLIIDGNAMMHRAFHAIPPLTAPDGSVVNVVYGFANMLLRLHESLAPSHMAVTFDRPVPTFRKKLYTGYQSKRPKMDESLVEQIPKVHELVASLGLPIFEKDGFEADDVIGTLATHAPSPIDQVVIVTGDRDILQLVDGDRVLVYMPTKGISEGKIYHEADVMERLGVLPVHITDFKGLAGDASDNYPGVEGIGPKTALGLLSKFGTVEEIYAYIDTLNNELGVENNDEWLKQGFSQGTLDKLNRGKDMAFLSKDLATIRTNVELDIVLKPVPTLNTESTKNELMKFHFHSLLKRLAPTSITTSSELRGAGEEDKNQIEKTKSEQQELF
jgi:DNA polymerase-1